jgi:hypothetical protein
MDGGKDAMNLILVSPFGNGGGQYSVKILDVLNEVRNGAEEDASICVKKMRLTRVEALESHPR